MFIYPEPVGRWNLVKHLDFTGLAVDDWSGDASKTVNGLTVTLRNSSAVTTFGPDGSTGVVLAPDQNSAFKSNTASAPGLDFLLSDAFAGYSSAHADVAVCLDIGWGVEPAASGDRVGVMLGTREMHASLGYGGYAYVGYTASKLKGSGRVGTTSHATNEPTAAGTITRLLVVKHNETCIVYHGTGAIGAAPVATSTGFADFTRYDEFAVPASNPGATERWSPSTDRATVWAHRDGSATALSVTLKHLWLLGRV